MESNTLEQSTTDLNNMEQHAGTNQGMNFFYKSGNTIDLSFVFAIEQPAGMAPLASFARSQQLSAPPILFCHFWYKCFFDTISLTSWKKAFQNIFWHLYKLAAQHWCSHFGVALPCNNLGLDLRQPKPQTIGSNMMKSFTRQNYAFWVAPCCDALCCCGAVMLYAAVVLYAAMCHCLLKVVPKTNEPKQTQSTCKSANHSGKKWKATWHRS